MTKTIHSIHNFNAFKEDKEDIWLKVRRRVYYTITAILCYYVIYFNETYEDWSVVQVEMEGLI